jgi:hypothetical protein
MKNLNIQIASPLIQGKLFLAAISFIFSMNGICQKNMLVKNENIGIGATSMITADGYGGQYSPMVYYKKDRRSYFIGPVIQNKNFNVSGVQFNYDYTLAGEDATENETSNETLELFCFLTIIYQQQALLGSRTLWEESRTKQGYEGNAGKLQFKSLEVYSGIGLKIRLFKNFKWVSSIGVGGYTSFNFPGHMYYNASNLGLIIKTGVSFDLKN